ncbi:MAG: proprotein convertase P-domain-containing protein [Hyphomicrobiaceae bacterium]
MPVFTASSFVPAFIPDENATGVTSILSTVGIPTGVRVLDMKVAVDIVHSYDGDLKLRLINPQGTAIALANNVGGAGDNFTGTIFHSGTADPLITTGVAPFTGTFRPVQALETLYSGQMAGDWKLTIIDDLLVYSGILHAWSLSITYAYNGRVTGTEAGSDDLRGSDFADHMDGLGRNDLIRALDGNDILIGGLGNDDLDGGPGNDILIGGRGKEDLIGGLGRDDFVYESIRDSRIGNGKRDFIVDFEHGRDDIDLRQIDAVKGVAGDQKFKFIGDDRFSGDPGELRFRISGGDTIVSGDIDGDRKADFEIELSGVVTLSKGDFLL